MPDRPPYELVIPRPLWETALRDLLLHPDHMAVGVCRRNRHAGADELLIETLETTSQPPSGASRPPLDDWVVLGVPGRETERTLPGWLEQLQPRRTQLLAVGLVGLGPDRSAWTGAVVESGTVHPLDAIRVVGPGMLRVSRNEDIASAAEQRWSRTRGALGDAVWKKVEASRVLLLGAGRNGSAMAFQLVALGIRAITLVDPDILETENLDAGFCVTEQDVGRPKTEALQRRLHAFRSDCLITSLPVSATHPTVTAKAAGGRSDRHLCRPRHRPLGRRPVGAPFSAGPLGRGHRSDQIDRGRSQRAASIGGRRPPAAAATGVRLLCGRITQRGRRPLRTGRTARRSAAPAAAAVAPAASRFADHVELADRRHRRATVARSAGRSASHVALGPSPLATRPRPANRRRPSRPSSRLPAMCSLKPMVSRSNFIFRGEDDVFWRTNPNRREK
jgi:hypothetical protein